MVFSRVAFLTSLVPLFSWRRVLTCKFAYKVALLRVLFLMSFVRLCSGIGILPVNFCIEVALVCLHVDCVALPLRDPLLCAVSRCGRHSEVLTRDFQNIKPNLETTPLSVSGFAFLGFFWKVS